MMPCPEPYRMFLELPNLESWNAIGLGLAGLRVKGVMKFSGPMLASSFSEG